MRNVEMRFVVGLYFVHISILITLAAVNCHLRSKKKDEFFEVQPLTSCHI
jgi:hypothetical protein